MLTAKEKRLEREATMIIEKQEHERKGKEGMKPL